MFEIRVIMLLDIKKLYKKEFELYDEVFEIDYRDDDIPYSKITPRGSMVTEVLKQLKDIWSDISQASKVLKDESESYLSCLLLTGPQPHRALPNISRSALFNERIFIPHPMLSYLDLLGEKGPFYKPDEWATQFLRTALYISSLRKWVTDDFLRLVPNPSKWSNNVKDRVSMTYLMSEDKKEKLINEMKEKYKFSYKDEGEFFAEFLADSDSEIRQLILDKLKRENPKLYEIVMDSIKSQPIMPEWLEFNNINRVKGEIIHNGVVFHPIEVQYLINNWNIYITPTTKLMECRMLDNMTEKNIINNFLYKFPVKFPNDIPNELMYSLRKSGLLENFRKYLLEQLENLSIASNEEDFAKLNDLYNNTIMEKYMELEEELETAKSGILKDILDVSLNNLGTFMKGSIDVSIAMNFAGGLISKTVPRVKKHLKARKNPLIVLHKINRT